MTISEFVLEFRKIDYRDISDDANEFARAAIDWGIPKDRGEMLALLAAAFEAGMRWSRAVPADRRKG